MPFVASWIVRALSSTFLILSLSCSTLSGPDIKIVANEHSQRVSAETTATDRAQCDEIAKEVQREYGPHPPYSDSPFADAATLRGHLNNYAAACMKVKGYEVERRFGLQWDEVDLPGSAVAKARGEEAPK